MYMFREIEAFGSLRRKVREKKLRVVSRFCRLS